MELHERTDLTITAAYPGLAAARVVVAALQAAGIDAARIAIGTDQAMGQAPRVRSNETPLLWRVLILGAVWSIVGGVIGAIVGLVLGVYGIGVPGTPDNVGIQIASWAMFLHVAGALVGCYLALDTGDNFATTGLHHDADRVQVRVRAQHRAEYETAEEVMGRVRRERIEE
jgi:hypothetical protein